MWKEIIIITHIITDEPRAKHNEHYENKWHSDQFVIIRNFTKLSDVIPFHVCGMISKLG